MNDETKVTLLFEGNDAMNIMLNVFFSGFASGAGSTLATIGSEEPEAAEFVHGIVNSLANDPLGVEEVRQAILSIMNGTAKTGPVAQWRLPPQSE